MVDTMATTVQRPRRRYCWREPSAGENEEAGCRRIQVRRAWMSVAWLYYLKFIDLVSMSGIIMVEVRPSAHEEKSVRRSSVFINNDQRFWIPRLAALLTQLQGTGTCHGIFRKNHGSVKFSLKNEFSFLITLI